MVECCLMGQLTKNGPSIHNLFYFTAVYNVLEKQLKASMKVECDALIHR